MTDQAAVYAAILANPGDDTPRGAYADLLDDTGAPGDAARAAFIRVQCELARLPDCGHRQDTSPGQPGGRLVCERCRLLLRERELLHGLSPIWEQSLINLPETGWGCDNFFNGSKPVVPGLGYVTFSRGFVDAARLSLAAFLGGPCGRCDDGRIGQHHDPSSDTMRGGRACPACSGTGQVTGIAAALFVAHPVRVVHLTDMRPWHVSMGGWHWWEGVADINHRDRTSVLPPDLFEAMWELHPAERAGWEGAGG